jgi:hypothetical protein
VRHPHWTSDHRDALLTRVSAITVGVAAASAVGAVALGAGLQAGTTYAASKKAAPAPDTATEPQAPVEAQPDASTPSTQPDDSAPSSGTATALSPEQIHLVIYNATTTRGVAAAAAKILRQEGFHVDSVAANPGGALRSSTILFSADTAGGVRAVSKATGIQQKATGDTGSTVVLVLGRDWVSATAGTAWAPPQAVAQQQGGSSGGSSSSGGTRSNGGGGGPATSSGGS